VKYVDVEHMILNDLNFPRHLIDYKVVNQIRIKVVFGKKTAKYIDKLLFAYGTLFFIFALLIGFCYYSLNLSHSVICCWNYVNNTIL
jgi:hypothetical protein